MAVPLIAAGVMGLAGAAIGSQRQGININSLNDQLTSPYLKDMEQRGNDLIDPTSSLMRMQKGQLMKQAGDNAYTQNRLMKQRMAGSGLLGQSGIMNQMQNQNVGAAGNQAMGQMGNMLTSNIGASTQLMQNVAQADIAKRQALGNAMSQNVASKNEANAAMGGGLLQMAGMFACWVAETLYGSNDAQTHLSRYYVLNTDNWFTKKYKQHGQKWARFLNRYPVFKPVVKPVWNYMAKQARRMINVN